MKISSSYGPVVVMGVSGSGKSTVGRLLAERLGCAFIEGDELHSAANIAKMHAGHPLNDDDRWPWLDRVGEAMRDEVARSGSAVASCSALKKSYRQRLLHAAGLTVAFVLLDADYDALIGRMKKRTDHFMPADLLSSQLQTLERPSAEERSVTLDATQSPAELCEAAVRWLAGDERSDG